MFKLCSVKATEYLTRAGLLKQKELTEDLHPYMFGSAEEQTSVNM